MRVEIFVVEYASECMLVYICMEIYFCLQALIISRKDVAYQETPIFHDHLFLPGVLRRTKLQSRSNFYRSTDSSERENMRGPS